MGITNKKPEELKLIEEQKKVEEKEALIQKAKFEDDLSAAFAEPEETRHASVLKAAEGALGSDLLSSKDILEVSENAIAATVEKSELPKSIKDQFRSFGSKKGRMLKGFAMSRANRTAKNLSRLSDTEIFEDLVATADNTKAAVALNSIITDMKILGLAVQFAELKKHVDFAGLTPDSPYTLTMSVLKDVPFLKKYAGRTINTKRFIDHLVTRSFKTYYTLSSVLPRTDLDYKKLLEIDKLQVDGEYKLVEYEPGEQITIVPFITKSVTVVDADEVSQTHYKLTHKLKTNPLVLFNKARGFFRKDGTVEAEPVLINTTISYDIFTKTDASMIKCFSAKKVVVEMFMLKDPQPLNIRTIADIFEKETAAAFGVPVSVVNLAVEGTISEMINKRELSGVLSHLDLPAFLKQLTGK